MNEEANNPFGENEAIEDEVYEQIAEAMPVGKEDEAVLESPKYEDNPPVEIDSTNAYPYINSAGEMKLGLSILLKEESSDSIFGDEEPNEGVLVIDSETGMSILTELEFSKESLNKKSKNIPDDVFNNLADVRKTISLSKAFKNLLNPYYNGYKDINTSKEFITILERTIKKTAETSKNMKAKISENSSDDLEGVLAEYAFKKHLLITGDAGFYYTSLLCA